MIIFYNNQSIITLTMIPSTDKQPKSYIGSLFSWMTNTTNNNNENTINKNIELNEPYVFQLATKNAHKTNNKIKSPQKNLVTSINVYYNGCQGDYNDYRTKHKKATNDRAVSIMTTQLIESFNNEGWPIVAGDLGENITVSGNIIFVVGETYSIGTTVLQITEDIQPCNKLMFLDYVGRENKVEFINMLKGRRGWYAKVLTEGSIVSGDKVKLIS